MKPFASTLAFLPSLSRPWHPPPLVPLNRRQSASPKGRLPWSPMAILPIMMF